MTAFLCDTTGIVGNILGKHKNMCPTFTVQPAFAMATGTEKGQLRMNVLLALRVLEQPFLAPLNAELQLDTIILHGNIRMRF